MAVQVAASLRLDQDAIRQITHGAGGPVMQALMRGTGRGRDIAKLNLTVGGFVDTGQLRNQIEASTYIRGTDLVGRVTSHAAHTMYVHDGTRGPIVPRRARVLRFRPKGSGTFVFATEVRGTQETGRFTPFMTDALAALTLSDFL